MTRGLLVACALAALAGVAAAEPKVQVLQSDGRADAKVRAKIDAAILALAKTAGAQILPGDITFGEAAAAVGCKPEDAACKDEVLGMLSVDEIVITTITPKPGGFDVIVRRVGKGGAPREALCFVTADRLDKLEPIAPLFAAKPAPAPAPAPTPTPTPPLQPPSSSATNRPAPLDEPPTNAPGMTPVITGPSGASIIETPPGDLAPPRGDDQPSGRSRPALAGMIGGGALAIAGLAFWGAAASVQREVDAAPTTTKAQLLELRELEKRGDGFANAGNLLFASGLVLGGISTYYFLKSGRRRARTARVVPVVLDGGAGLALSIGGTP